MPRTWIIVPTYDEVENLQPLLERIETALARCVPPVAATVLVVDDDSPDGTGVLADLLATTRPWLQVLHRGGKGGLAAAYVAGFHRALDAGADLVVQIDADLSHDPDDIPRLLEQAHAGADVVLGSRYLRGGGTEGWSAGRRLLSRAGGMYAAAVLGLGVSDPTGGFKCLTARTLRTLDLDALGSRGFGFQIEVTYAAAGAGLAIAEVPITFRERERGSSKMTAAIAAEALWRVPLLRLRAALAHRPLVSTP